MNFGLFWASDRWCSLLPMMPAGLQPQLPVRLLVTEGQATSTLTTVSAPRPVSGLHFQCSSQLHERLLDYKTVFGAS